VVRACDEDGGYRAVCDRGDHHRRTIRRHGLSARGNAASLSRPGLCVSGPRSRFRFHFFERGCEPRTEQRYGDLSHGLCSDRPTTLDVAQHIPCICNVAGGRFGAQPRPMGRMVGICSQRHRIHRLYLHRPAILPRTHPTNHTTLVRLRVTSGFGGFAVGVVVTLSFQIGPTGSGVLAVFPVIYTSIMLILHRRVGGPATAAVLANAVPALAGFGLALLTLHLAAVPLGSAAALIVALGVSVVWNAVIYAIRRCQALA
jgi:hypothetical protein